MAENDMQFLENQEGTENTGNDTSEGNTPEENNNEGTGSETGTRNDVNTGKPSEDTSTLFTAEREKNIRLQAELDILKRQSSQPVNYQNEERIRQERLSLMSPEERMQEEIKELKNTQKNTELMLQFQAADSIDRNNFLSVATGSNPQKAQVYSKNLAEVESLLNQYRKAGVYPTRQEVLEIVVGRQAMAALDKPVNKTARQEAQNRVSSSQGKPTTVTNSGTSSQSKGPVNTGSLSGDIRALTERIRKSK